MTRLGDRTVFGIVLNNRKLHGTVASGTEDFSAKTSHHTITVTGSQAWTLSEFTADTPEISVKITVSGGGTPTITVPGGSEFFTTQKLSALADGEYVCEVVSFDDGTSYEIMVGAEA
jgi:hypothetical protein